ncbi:hypothetical protein LEP1GSC172_4068 [Leptospira noguchii]|uniref:Uncharacterized protein n=1 Tax=Leptospira noguchii TaxID=28182 RepID=M6VLD8_9LEPT|nr:hypothetical protein LEP1GSC172_4068 [Leptospira noguchii]
MGGSKFGICRATFITLLSSKQNSEPTLKTRSFFYDFVFRGRKEDQKTRQRIKNQITILENQDYFLNSKTLVEID